MHHKKVTILRPYVQYTRTRTHPICVPSIWYAHTHTCPISVPSVWYTSTRTCTLSVPWHSLSHLYHASTLVRSTLLLVLCPYIWHSTPLPVPIARSWTWCRLCALLTVDKLQRYCSWMRTYNTTKWQNGSLGISLIHGYTSSHAELRLLPFTSIRKSSCMTWVHGCPMSWARRAQKFSGKEEDEKNKWGTSNLLCLSPICSPGWPWVRCRHQYIESSLSIWLQLFVAAVRSALSLIH